MRTRERIADRLLNEVEVALVRFNNARESDRSEARTALERALNRHSELVLRGKAPEEFTRPVEFFVSGHTRGNKE